MGLDAGDVLVTARAVAEWRDALYVVTAALQDVEADLRGRPTLAEYKLAFQHLYAAAAPLREVRVEPRAVGEGSDPSR